MRLAPEDRVDASNIEHLPIAVTGTNMMVPLEQIATITIDKGPARIQHLNGKRTVTVSANVQGVDAGTVTAEAKKIADAMDFPPGYGVGLGGASRDQAELFAEMGIALRHGHLRHVPGARDAVRLVHRADSHHVVAAAVADRRGARAETDAAVR